MSGKYGVCHNKYWGKNNLENISMKIVIDECMNEYIGKRRVLDNFIKNITSHSYNI